MQLQMYHTSHICDIDTILYLYSIIFEFISSYAKTKYVYSTKLSILRNIPTKFQLNPFSSLGVMVQIKSCKLTNKITNVNYLFHICNAK